MLEEDGSRLWRGELIHSGDDDRAVLDGESSSLQHLLPQDGALPLDEDHAAAVGVRRIAGREAHEVEVLLSRAGVDRDRVAAVRVADHDFRLGPGDDVGDLRIGGRRRRRRLLGRQGGRGEQRGEQGAGRSGPQHPKGRAKCESHDPLLS